LHLDVGEIQDVFGEIKHAKTNVYEENSIFLKNVLDLFFFLCHKGEVNTTIAPASLYRVAGVFVSKPV